MLKLVIQTTVTAEVLCATSAGMLWTGVQNVEHVCKDTDLSDMENVVL